MTTVTINRTLPQIGGKRMYLSVYYDNLLAASKLLTGEDAFKLYLYFLANQDQHTEHFSPQKFLYNFGTKLDKCRDALHQLEETGYLVKTGKDEYQFYEVPRPTLEGSELR